MRAGSSLSSLLRRLEFDPSLVLNNLLDSSVSGENLSKAVKKFDNLIEAEQVAKGTRMKVEIKS